MRGIPHRVRGLSAGCATSISEDRRPREAASTQAGARPSRIISTRAFPRVDGIAGGGVAGAGSVSRSMPHVECRGTNFLCATHRPDTGSLARSTTRQTRGPSAKDSELRSVGTRGALGRRSASPFRQPGRRRSSHPRARLHARWSRPGSREGPRQVDAAVHEHTDDEAEQVRRELEETHGSRTSREQIRLVWSEVRRS